MASNRADEVRAIRGFVTIRSSHTRLQCLWVKDAPPPRRARNEAFFQALKKRNEALKEYATYLESLLERCQREHGGLHDKAYMERRPRDINMSFDESNSGGNEVVLDGGDEGDATEIQDLIAPIQKLSASFSQPSFQALC